MAKVAQVCNDSEGVARSLWLLAGKTWSGQDERILEKLLKIVLLKESKVWFPDEKC